jgi:hypothetical protein
MPKPNHHHQKKPRIDKVEKLAAELAIASMGNSDMTVRRAVDLAKYCLDAADAIVTADEQDDDGA